MEYERNPKKWINGDTFYYKVENKNSIFYNKYLIFVKSGVIEWARDGQYIPRFWIMLTKNDKLPTTKEEIEKLECIKTRLVAWEERFLPGSGLIPAEELIKERSKVKFYPDEYNYLYTYQIGIVFTRKSTVPDEFKYLGNFDIKGPSDEYIPFVDAHYNVEYWDDILEKLKKSYTTLNKKQGYLYSKEGIKSVHENAKFTEKMAFMDIGKILEEVKDIPLTYNKGWGYKLYDNDVTLDVKDKYQSINKKDKSGEEITKIIFDEFSDYLLMEDEKNLVIMALADLLIKSKKLTKEVKEMALIAIEKDLKYWYDDNIFLYQRREHELGKLKKRLENNIF